MPNGPGDVTSGAPHALQYTEVGDGTVIDNVTGLMWQEDIAPGNFAWPAASSYCSATLSAPLIALGGHRDWRLPSRIELVSLVDYGIAPPSQMISGPLATSTPSAVFWSSTPAAIATTDAWDVSFSSGDTSSAAADNQFYVRCVR